MVLKNFNIMNFCKILLKFAFVFKIFEYFCHLRSFLTNEDFQVMQMSYLT